MHWNLQLKTKNNRFCINFKVMTIPWLTWNSFNIWNSIDIECFVMVKIHYSIVILSLFQEYRICIFFCVKTYMYKMGRNFAQTPLIQNEMQNLSVGDAIARSCMECNALAQENLTAVLDEKSAIFRPNVGLSVCLWERFMKLVTRMCLLRDESAVRNVESSWGEFADGKHNLYAFNVGNTRCKYINRLTRHYIHKSKRDMLFPNVILIKFSHVVAL